MTNTRRFSADMLNDPFFIGIDRVLNRLQEATPGQSNYPPYNIVKTDDNNYELQLAIAGFKQDDLDIEVKDGILTIEGNKDTEEETTYIHKGISARAFRRTFTLSDTIIINGADLTDGILTIKLENVIPEEKKPRKIAIGGSTADTQLLHG